MHNLLTHVFSKEHSSLLSHPIGIGGAVGTGFGEIWVGLPGLAVVGLDVGPKIGNWSWPSII